MTRSEVDIERNRATGNRQHTLLTERACYQAPTLSLLILDAVSDRVSVRGNRRDVPGLSYDLTRAGRIPGMRNAWNDKRQHRAEDDKWSAAVHYGRDIGSDRTLAEQRSP
ncbi:MAG: hypothetical protein WKF96_12450 [Solirubrobacteraceae bacterium]